MTKQIYRAGYKPIIAILNSIIFLSVTVMAQSPIDAYILQKMKDNNIPGVGISYIKDGKIAMAKGYGHANINQDIPFTQHTIMEIASISKTITATAAMQLWEQGFFDIDDPVNKYLPFAVVNPFFPDDTITIRMLLNHSSSMGFGLSLVNGEVEQISVLPGHTISLDSFLRSHLLPGGALYTDTLSFQRHRPGFGYSYSNFAMTMLAYIVEILSGQDFDAYCQQHIFEPLCMFNTACFYKDLDTTIVARSYKGDSVLTDYPLWEWSEYPGVGIKSTVIDISRFMLMHLNYGYYDGHQIIDTSTEIMMRTVQFVLQETFIPHDGEYLPVQQAQCLGMDMITEHNLGDLQIFGKSGQSYGICTRTYFIPAENALITAIANGNIGDGINLPLIDILLELHFLDPDSIPTNGKAALDCEAYQPCQHHQEYWSHQPEWTINAVPMVIGTKEVYTKDEVLALFNEPQNNDASIVLGQALAAAKLNIAQGSALSPILMTVNEAMALIGEERLPFKHPVLSSSPLGQEMLTLALLLADYNEGEFNVTPCSGILSALPADDHDGDSSSFAVSVIPNPVNNTATIFFTLPRTQKVSLCVFETGGSQVAQITNAAYPEGKNMVQWDAAGLRPGMYYLQMRAGGLLITEKLVVAK